MRVKDLKDQISTDGPRPFLKCFQCDRETSGNAGDYWNVPEDYTFMCCDVEMSLVTAQTVYDVVTL